MPVSLPEKGEPDIHGAVQAHPDGFGLGRALSAVSYRPSSGQPEMESWSGRMAGRARMLRSGCERY